MTTGPDAIRAKFAKLAKQLASGDETLNPHRDGFGTGSLFIGRKMFGVLDESKGLVLKLPPERVRALIDAGVGAPWHPGQGKPLKEYVAIPMGHSARWLALARESRAYMGSKH
jgi:hypothetical protein